eukprot:4140396-Amphidinium_carterae.1
MHDQYALGATPAPAIREPVPAAHYTPCASPAIREPFASQSAYAPSAMASPVIREPLTTQSAYAPSAMATPICEPSAVHSGLGSPTVPYTPQLRESRLDFERSAPRLCICLHVPVGWYAEGDVVTVGVVTCFAPQGGIHTDPPRVWILAGTGRHR